MYDNTDLIRAVFDNVGFFYSKNVCHGGFSFCLD